MKELERKFCVAQSTVAGIISRLEQKGFVEAFGDASDKRIKLVHITPDGEACCREAAGYMAEAEQMLLHGFPRMKNHIQSASGKSRKKYEVNTAAHGGFRSEQN